MSTIPFQPVRFTGPSNPPPLFRLTEGTAASLDAALFATYLRGQGQGPESAPLPPPSEAATSDKPAATDSAQSDGQDEEPASEETAGSAGTPYAPAVTEPFLPAALTGEGAGTTETKEGRDGIEGPAAILPGTTAEGLGGSGDSVPPEHTPAVAEIPQLSEASFEEALRRARRPANSSNGGREPLPGEQTLPMEDAAARQADRGERFESAGAHEPWLEPSAEADTGAEEVRQESRRHSRRNSRDTRLVGLVEMRKDIPAAADRPAPTQPRLTPEFTTSLPGPAPQAEPGGSAAPVPVALPGVPPASLEAAAAGREVAAGASAEGPPESLTPLRERGSAENVGRAGERPARGAASLDQARFVERVQRALQAAQSRGGVLRLRLSPPELGSLQLRVHVQDGTLSARVEADNAEARSALLDSLPVLRERLAEQGIRLEQFDVNLPDRQPGTPHDRPHDPDPPRGRLPRDEPRREYGGEAPAPESPRPVLHRGQLNVIA